jgi:hypothetical protein
VRNVDAVTRANSLGQMWVKGIRDPRYPPDPRPLTEVVKAGAVGSETFGA